MYDRDWARAVARARGLAVDDERAERLAATVGPILERFQEIARELTADDDIYEFRRLLAQEGLRG
jgi:hypothetical protein